jgi:oxygen-dependent protoporphyrinogen oxidase
MVGGARDPEAIELDDEALLGVVARDLARAMDLDADPVRHWIFRYPRGIPQYEIDHGRRLRRALDGLRHHPGIRLAGNSYRGISVNSVVEEAAAARARTPKGV